LNIEPTQSRTFSHRSGGACRRETWANDTAAHYCVVLPSIPTLPNKDLYYIVTHYQR